jgi:hypothetical protein
MSSMRAINQQAFLGSVVILGVLWGTFSMGTRKQSGHGLFDTQKPEAVQTMMDERRSKGN